MLLQNDSNWYIEDRTSFKILKTMWAIDLTGFNWLRSSRNIFGSVRVTFGRNRLVLDLKAFLDLINYLLSTLFGENKRQQSQENLGNIRLVWHLGEPNMIHKKYFGLRCLLRMYTETLYLSEKWSVNSLHIPWKTCCTRKFSCNFLRNEKQRCEL